MIKYHEAREWNVHVAHAGKQNACGVQSQRLAGLRLLPIMSVCAVRCLRCCRCVHDEQRDSLWMR